MFMKKLKLALVLVAVLACATAGVFLYAAARSEPVEPDPASAPSFVAVADKIADKKGTERKEGDPRITMTVFPPQFRVPEPELLPDFKFWEIKVQFKNDGKEEVVLAPFVDLKVFDAANKPVDNDVLIGVGFGGEEYMNDLESRFLVIPAGKTGELLVNVGDNRGPLGTIGWKLEKAGAYRIELAYRYERKTFAAQCFKAPFFIDDAALARARAPGRLWNRAVEMERVTEVKLVVPK